MTKYFVEIIGISLLIISIVYIVAVLNLNVGMAVIAGLFTFIFCMIVVFIVVNGEYYQ